MAVIEQIGTEYLIMADRRVTLAGWRVALLVAGAVASARGEACRAVGAALEVSSNRNATGHWETRVFLRSVSTAPGRGADAIRLTVSPSTSFCGATRYDDLRVTLAGPPPGPGAGYTAVPGIGYYRIHVDKLSWEDARAACEAEGAHLLVLESEAEHNAIKKLLSKTPGLTTWLFIVFHDKDKEGNYVTIFGDPLAAVYQKWHQGQPDDTNKNEDCGTLWNSGDMNDLVCSSKMGYICEQRVA